MTPRILPETTTVRSLGGPLAAGRHAHRLALLRAGLLTLASVVAVAAFGGDATAATVATDQPDYHVGQTVGITGSGWTPGETVVMILHEDPPLDPDLQLTSVADVNGDFTNTDFIVDVFDIGVTFTLTATGLSSGLTAETTFTDASGTCGDGTVDTGEQCDMGALNGSGSCCKNNCTFWDSSHIRRDAAGACDLPETCTGTSATCPADTGAVKAAGTACTDDGNPCTLDQCNGTSTSCQHPAGNAGAVCRAAAGPCDVAETCTGASPTCPADAFLPSSTVCRAAAGECDLAENCPGNGPNCPADAKESAGTAGTADSNPCKLDQCNGTSNSCQHPAGHAGAVCRAAAGDCDLAATCTGTSTTCPSNPFKPSGTACPDDGDPCTTDSCDGTNTSCQHPPGNAGAVCRAAANECDVAETCPGAIIIMFHGAAGASTGTALSATSLSLLRPSGTLANDVMVASITAHDGSSVIPTITAPAGWTLIVNTTSNGQNLAVSTYWKVAGTTFADPGPYTFTVSPSSRIAGGISAYFNVDTTNPINA